MKRFLVIFVLLLFLLESCVIGSSRRFITPPTVKPLYHIQIIKDYRKFFIPPFFLCQFVKKRGLYLLEYDFFTKDSLIYTELTAIKYVFYDEIGGEISSGNFDINSKIERQILIGNESLKIPTDTLYRASNRTIPQIMIPDSIERITADFTLYLQQVNGDMDSLKISNEYKLDRGRGIYGFF